MNHGHSRARVGIGECNRSLFLGVLSRKQALDLPKMVEVVPGHHLGDAVDALLAALGVHAELLPLLQ